MLPHIRQLQQRPRPSGQDDIGIGEIEEGIEPLVEGFGSYLFIYP